MEPNNDKDKKLYLIIGILLVIVLFVLRSLIVSNNEALIDYDAVVSGYQLVSQGEQTYDREIYYIVEGIISNIGSAYINEDELEYTIEDYYDVLNKSYKNKISKSKYLDLINIFFERLTTIDTSGMGEYKSLNISNSIRAIYDIGDDKYICLIGLKEQPPCGFIGIALNTDNNTYEIFYLE